MKLIIIVAIMLVVLLLIKNPEPKEVPCGCQEERPAQNWPRRPRDKPVYIDDPTMYLDQRIWYSEWDQKLNSVVI